MAPYHILIVMIWYVIPEILVLLTKSEQFGPKSAHIRPTSLYQKVVFKGVSKTVSAYLDGQITGIVSVHSWGKKKTLAALHSYTSIHF